MTQYLADDVGDIARRMKELSLERSVPTEQRPLGSGIYHYVPTTKLPEGQFRTRNIEIKPEDDWDYGT
jgi:hypothetical protein